MAAEKPWHYLQNTILIVTAASYRAMMIISKYTLLALLASTNTVIVALGTALQPFYDDFKLKYNAWISQLGTQIGDVDAMYIELQLIRSTKARNWDSRITAVWDITSSLYKAALPDRRKGMQMGSQEDIIAYITNISTKLIGVIALAAVKTDIDAHLTILNNLLTTKDTAKIGTKTSSNEVENSRIILAGELYGVLGQLMYIFRMSPLSVIPFFDISAIRNSEQTLWKRISKPHTTKYVFTRTLLATDTLRLVNSGLEPITFGFVANKTDAMPLTGTYTVPALDGETVPRADLGPMPNRYMIVQNASGIKLKYMIVII